MSMTGWTSGIIRPSLAPRFLLGMLLLASPAIAIAGDLHHFGGRWHDPSGLLETSESLARSGGRCLQLLGRVEFTPEDPVEAGAQLSFWAERWTARPPFSFRIEAKTGSGWEEIYRGDQSVKVGRKFLSHVTVPVPDGSTSFRFEADAPAGTGVLLDELRIAKPTPMRIRGIHRSAQVTPVLIGKPDNPLLQFTIETEGELEPKTLTGLQFRTDGPRVTKLNLIADGIQIGQVLNGRFNGEHTLRSGVNHFTITGSIDPQAKLGTQVDAYLQGLAIGGKAVDREIHFESSKRVGIALRQQGQDDCHSYRIPGLATTTQGTLIAVYDNRYRSTGDLPGDVDVGMSRSSDGGQTWETMRVIMDMGDDPAWSYDGVGDPAILVDDVTGAIWVAATWSHGQRSWHGSGPGLLPEDTGQLMLTRSDDDGLTWSKPINITEQVKDPAWRFVLQGPGNGISLKDGTLVFPAQYRSADGEPDHGKPFSTIIHSLDRGETWKIGSGVKIDTTEAQVVQLGDSSIMINCRDNRGGSRSVYTTRDLGRSWQIHPSDRRALPDPTCNADLLRLTHAKHGPLLIFSNPNTTRGRTHLTLKVSKDEGLSWPERFHTLYDARTGGGYSSLTQIDAEHIGVLYEGVGELYFLSFRIDELVD